jgi:hypothetical protein
MRRVVLALICVWACTDVRVGELGALDGSDDGVDNDGVGHEDESGEGDGDGDGDADDDSAGDGDDDHSDPGGDGDDDSEAGDGDDDFEDADDVDAGLDGAVSDEEEEETEFSRSLPEFVYPR